MKKFIIVAAIVAVIVLVGYGVNSYLKNRIYNDPSFAHGNGRIEATDVNITTKFSERIAEVKVHEGDLVQKGQVLAVMQTATLKAELAQAQARKAQAEAELAQARASIELRKSELETAKATVAQKKSAFDGNKKRYERAKELLKNEATSQQHYENDETLYLTSQAELKAAEAGVKTAEANVKAAEAEAMGAEANIKAAEADIAKIQVNLDDSELTAPLKGRIQFRTAEPGEVLGAGGKVLSLVDLTDVYMTFFLPEATAGKVKIGAEARILLDALPNVAIPAKITFVSSVAQFTPKTVETQVERQKLMFRIKAHIDPELLNKYIDYVKTGLPGVTWVKLNPDAKWPDFLKLKDEK
ncbi:MAG: HlyD family efflux transporter periplasmic adaptor subunit [Lentisphaeria bacterium]|nr:HlyD family efflux transporter periplasmic adaptor subunit [Lentisphaeria bacterium]